MAKPTRISELNNAPGGPLASDQIPIARGAGASGQTYKVLANQLLTNFLSAVDTPTIDLDFDTTTGVLKADAKSTVLLASELNATDSPTIDLNWNSSTKTLSANVNDSSITNAKIAFDGGAFAFRNKIINGDMRISQRGTSFSGITLPGLDKYTLDRFIANSTSSGVVTVTQDTSAPTATKEFGYSLKCEVTTADTSLTSSEYVTIYQKIEGFNVRDLINSTFTLSFWVRSSKTGIHSIAFRNGTTFPNYDASYVVEYTINTANTWEYKTITVNGGINNTVGTFWNFTNGGGLSVLFTIAAASNVSTSTLGSWQALNRIASTNQVNVMDTVGNTFFITGVQLEKGPTATPFEHRPFGTELALCQRYYEKSYNIDVAPGTANTAASIQFFSQLLPLGLGQALLFYHNVRFKVKKRTSPLIVNIYSPNSGALNRFWAIQGTPTANSYNLTPTQIAQDEDGIVVNGGYHILASQANGYVALFNYVADAEL